MALLRIASVTSPCISPIRGAIVEEGRSPFVSSSSDVSWPIATNVAGVSVRRFGAETAERSRPPP